MSSITAASGPPPPRRREFRLGDLVQLDVAIAALDRLPGRLDDIVAISVPHQACIDFDLVGKGAAKQSGQRQSGDFAEDVPQRDVDRRDAVHDRSDPAEILKLKFEIVFDLAISRALRPITSGSTRVSIIVLKRLVFAARECLAPTDNALLGFQPHEQMCRTAVSANRRNSTAVRRRTSNGIETRIASALTIFCEACGHRGAQPSDIKMIAGLRAIFKWPLTGCRVSVDC